MKNTKYFNRGTGLMLGAALLGAALIGCVEEGPIHGSAYASVEDDFVYYPGYEVYYGAHSHRYYYPEGRSWVSRARPPHVSPEVLSVAPSVKLDFRDHPSAHHAAVVQKYPKHWAPP